MEDDKGSGGSQKIKTICWNSGKSFLKSLVGGEKREQSAGVEHQKELKQNRNYMRQPISKKRFLAYEGNTTAKEKELLISFALHEFLEHC